MRASKPSLVVSGLVVIGLLAAVPALAGSYVNFESSHVHPIDLTPSGERLLAVNTPDALLEVFPVRDDGSLGRPSSIRVGLEPVTVVARSDDEAWVVNYVSDTVSIVDLAAGVVTRTLDVGDEPTDVAFTAGKAFVAVSQEDLVRVYDLSNLDAAPAQVPLFGRDVRALAVSNDGKTVYAVVLHSGNQTTIVNRNVLFEDDSGLDGKTLDALGLTDIDCDGKPLAYPPLPAGITRDPALPNPTNGTPAVSLIVKWDDGRGAWVDEAGQDWSHCIDYRMPDHDLFAIDAGTLGVSTVSQLGTTLFDVSVHPVNGRLYVPNTEARNLVRFEHGLGLRGHVVDNRLSIVDPANADAVTILDLNGHIDREAAPRSSSATRGHSVAQPGMLVWRSNGTKGYLASLGSNNVFEVDGACMAPGCIFGPNRAAPRRARAGLGPSGLALHENKDRLYVLNRIEHSVAVIKASELEILDRVPLHDPTSELTRSGRRFLYDATDSSAHGDASCASCHISGDRDLLAWDLGNPEGKFVPYDTQLDNVRFVVPIPDLPPQECDAAAFPQGCASQDGFDPQKGPMTTQTLRGMTEPLHWRGDKATMLEFNSAFVNLLGAESVSDGESGPRGLSDADMALFRQFALSIATPPNPFRTVDDTLPCAGSTDPGCEVQVPGMLLPGNPADGKIKFETIATVGPNTCIGCHSSRFGTASGKLMGVTPAEPTSPLASALFNGALAGAPHNDLTIPHLRNMYDKVGPVVGSGTGSPPDAKTGFGYEHDGSMPDVYRFLSNEAGNFSSANQAETLRDIAAFMFHFPTETRPAVGRQLTLPAGAPPTGSPAQESLLRSLERLGDGADPERHCELVATTISAGRPRGYRLSGGAWAADASDDPAVSTTSLRQDATAPITFHCVTIGSGERLGINRDEDARLDGDDCAPGDGGSWGLPVTVTDVSPLATSVARFGWSDQSLSAGSGRRFDVIGGSLTQLRASGVLATSCVASGLDRPLFEDPAPSAPGQGSFYLVRTTNGCGTSPLGPGREAAATTECATGP